ncbi:MAG: DUF58 domain-containing protein [Mangrovibacterium sp.]
MCVSKFNHQNTYKIEQSYIEKTNNLIIVANSNQIDINIFASLNSLLELEHFATSFNYRPKRQRVNSTLSGKHTSRMRGRGLDFEEVRLYVKGDDIRNIDWKVTARTQKTHTRVYTEEKEKPVLVIVDQSKAMFFGSVLRTKSVVAAELAAIVAFKVVKEGDRVGGIVYADNGIDVIAPKRDRKTILHFLEKIAQRNQELQSSTPVVFENALAETVQRVKNIATHDFMVVLISDFHRYSPRVIKSIHQIAAHNDVMLIKVFDPLEQSLPGTKFIAGNRTHQIAIDGSNKTIRSNYTKGFDSDFYLFQEEMKKRGIPVFTVDTVNPIDQQLKDLFKINRKVKA